jgi:hypothetical protein
MPKRWSIWIEPQSQDFNGHWHQYWRVKDPVFFPSKEEADKWCQLFNISPDLMMWQPREFDREKEES